jgi:TRAP-type C4-dicarboxylate transport system permease small subunit
VTFWKKLGLFEHGLASIGAGLCLFIIMIVTVLSVLGRYVLAMDLVPGAFNMIERIFFPLMVFWAMPIAYREGAFPRLDFIVEKLSERWKALAAVFVVAVELIIYLALAYYAWTFAWDGIKTQLTTPIGINHWPIYPVLVMVPFAFALMIVEMLYLLWADLSKAFGHGHAAAGAQAERSDLLD